jgi:hypothetical protein
MSEAAWGFAPRHVEHTPGYTAGEPMTVPPLERSPHCRQRSVPRRCMRSTVSLGGDGEMPDEQYLGDGPYVHHETYVVTDDGVLRLVWWISEGEPDDLALAPATLLSYAASPAPAGSSSVGCQPGSHRQHACAGIDPHTAAAPGATSAVHRKAFINTDVLWRVPDQQCDRVQ